MVKKSTKRHQRAPMPIRCAIGALACLFAIAAPAADYPSKPVRIIVGFGAGSSVDTTGRILAEKLQKVWRNPVFVENKPGAGGNIAAEQVTREPPDGYTLLLTPTTITISPALYPKLNYSPSKQLKPITQVSSMPHVLVANKDLPADDVASLIKLAQTRNLNYASSGAGGSDHIAGELFQHLTQTSMTHIAYRGGQQGMMDLIGGSVDIYFAGAPVTLPFIQADKIKALGVSTQDRIAALAHVPPIGEFVPGYVVDAWYGFFAPERTPPAVIDRIASGVRQALADDEVRESLIKLGLKPIGSTPKEFSGFVEREYLKWAQLVHDANITVDGQ